MFLTFLRIALIGKYVPHIPYALWLLCNYYVIERILASWKCKDHTDVAPPHGVTQLKSALLVQIME